MRELDFIVDGLIDIIMDANDCSAVEAGNILSVYLQTESFVEDLKQFAK